MGANDLTQNVTAPRTCPRCGKPLSPFAPAGLCPNCLLESEPSHQPSVPGSASTSPVLLRYFGDYELLEEIARGGMGVVYKARQVSLNRTVAVKMILAGQLASAAEIQRFRHEAESAANLQHPNIVAIHEVGEHEGQQYFSMDFVEGESLAEVVRENPLPATRAATYVKSIAEAVHYAHQRGVVHRDLKPSNVLIDSFDQPRVTDFGLAKRLPPKSEVRNEKSEIHLTLSGAVMGTPAYMSPEQASGKSKDVGPLSDVYSLGAILYELLVGRPPFRAETPVETMVQVVHAEPVSPRLLNPNVARDLETICLKCLEKEPTRRYATAQDLAEELGRFLRVEPIQARPVSHPERFWRWCLRHPAVSSLAAATVFIFVIGFVGVLWQWQRANHNAELHSRERQRAERILSQMETRKVEESFAANDTSQALAYLAQAVTRDPSNRVAGERLLSALTYRSFALPLTPLLRHEGAVSSARFSPDGTRVVTASTDGTARLWDATTGFTIGQPMRHTAGVNYATFSPDGRRIVTVSQDKTARLWDGHTTQPQGEPLLHEADVRFADFSPDGQRLVTVATNKSARLWDCTSGQPLSPWLLHDRPGNFAGPGAFEQRPPSLVEDGPPAQFSPDGLILATACGDNTVRLWDGRMGRSLLSPLLHLQMATAVQFMANPLRLRAKARERIALWDPTTGQSVKEPYFGLALDTQLAGSIEIDRDNEWLALTWNREGVSLWSERAGARAYTMLAHSGIRWSKFSDDGEKLASVSSDFSVKVWEVRTAYLLCDPIHLTNEITWVEFSPDGHRVLVASREGTAAIWDVRPGNARSQALLQKLSNGGYADIARVHFSSNASSVLTIAKEGPLQTWNVEEARVISQFNPPGRTGVDFSRDGRRIVVTVKNSLRVWDTVTGQPLTEPLPHEGQVFHAKISPDGQYLTARTFKSNEVTTLLWNLTQARPVKSILAGASDSGVMLTVSLDSQRLVTANSNLLSVWKARTGERVTVLTNDARVIAASFSANRERVFSVTERSFNVWSAETGRRIVGPMPHEGHVSSARFSDDGALVFTATREGARRVWESATGQPTTEAFSTPQNQYALVMPFSGEGDRVAVPSDPFLQLVDPRTGQQVSEMLDHADAWEGTTSPQPVNVVSASFSVDGQRLVTITSGDVARVWDVPTVPIPIPSWLPRLAEALAGRRLDKRGFLQRLSSPEALASAHAESASHGASDRASAWLNWFWADRFSRRVSPFIGEKAAHYAQDLVQAIESHSVIENFAPSILRLAPSNGVVLAWMSVRLGQHPAKAARYSEGSLQLAPSNAIVWKLRSQFLDNSSDLKSAIAALERAIELNPQQIDYWMEKARLLERAHDLEGTYRALTRAFELSEAKPDRKRDVDVELEANEYLLARSSLLKRIGRPAEAQADFLRAKNIPARDPKAPRELVDLNSVYNASLNKWESVSISRQILYYGLETLPRGIVHLAGVDFDARGVIQVGWAAALTNSVTIPVNQTVKRIHFLHGALPDDKSTNGMGLGHYFLNPQGQPGYVALPIILGKEVLRAGEEVGPESRATVAWTATNEPSYRLTAGTPRLFKTTWEAPDNDALFVESIAFNANLGLPFLVALTVESARGVDVVLAQNRRLESGKKVSEAIELLERASREFPEELEVWHRLGVNLQATNRVEEALRAFSKSIELARASMTTERETLHHLLDHRVTLLKRLGRLTEAAKDFLELKGIPPRDAKADARLIDLSLHFTDPLKGTWHPHDAKDTNANDLASLPIGIQRLAGTDFDVRGVIQLSGSALRPNTNMFPRRVDGIRIGQKVRGLHFLQAAAWAGRLVRDSNGSAQEEFREIPGTTIGSYLIHYSDGRTEEAPIRLGPDVREWWHWPESQPDDPALIIAWQGTNAANRNAKASVRLFKSSWKNPHPDIEITSIDFTSAMNKPAPFLIAITAE